MDPSRTVKSGDAVWIKYEGYDAVECVLYAAAPPHSGFVPVPTDESLYDESQGILFEPTDD